MKIFAVLGLSVAVAGLSVPAPASAQPAAGDYVHASGLTVIAASHDQVVPADLRGAYAAYDALSEAYPEDFGYASPNLADGTVSLGVVTAKGRAALASLSAGRALPATAALGDSTEAAQKRSAALTQAAKPAAAVTAATKPVTRSRALVEQDKDALIEWSRDRRFAEADIWQTSVERSTGRVVVTVAKLTPLLAETIVARYGTEKVAVQIEENPQLQPNIGRLADNHPFYGGSRINTPLGSCTDAFSWRIGSTPAMVTAGHCVANGGSVSTPTSSLGTVNNASRETWNNGTGTVTVPGYSGYHGDGAIIQVTGGNSSTNRVYRGAYNSTSSSPVLGMWSRRAQNGDQYCTSGSFSGEICGWSVSSSQVNVTYSSGEVARNVVRSGNKQGWCTRSGDSGGSIFTATSSGVTAKGVHSAGGGGGSDSYGGLLDPCNEVFTDIWDIYYGLPGNLL
jgi:hypothetical protein